MTITSLPIPNVAKSVISHFSIFTNVKLCNVYFVAPFRISDTGYSIGNHKDTNPKPCLSGSKSTNQQKLFVWKIQSELRDMQPSLTSRSLLRFLTAHAILCKAWIARVFQNKDKRRRKKQRIARKIIRCVRYGSNCNPFQILIKNSLFLPIFSIFRQILKTSANDPYFLVWA